MRIHPTGWLLALLLIAPVTHAGMADIGTLLPAYSINSNFGPMSVQSDVYSMGGMYYLYTYVLTNPINSTENASWFSVSIGSGAKVLSVGHDTGMNIPAVWHEIGNPIIAIDAQFQDPLSPGETSTTLYFLSTQLPKETRASVGGISSSGTVVYTNVVNSPVPEPATMLLLAAGACMSIRRHPKK